MARVKTETQVLFEKLKNGDPILNTLDILKKLIMNGDDRVHNHLMDEFPDKLDAYVHQLEPNPITGAGWRMLAHYSSDAIKLRLIVEFPEKMDIPGAYKGEGWMILSNYGSDGIKALVKSRRDIDA